MVFEGKTDFRPLRGYAELPLEPGAPVTSIIRCPGASILQTPSNRPAQVQLITVLSNRVGAAGVAELFGLVLTRPFTCCPSPSAAHVYQICMSDLSLRLLQATSQLPI